MFFTCFGYQTVSESSDYVQDSRNPTCISRTFSLASIQPATDRVPRLGRWKWAAVRGSVHQSRREILRLQSKWKHHKLKIPKQVPHSWVKTISSRFQQPYLEFVTFESPQNATLLTERSMAQSGATPNTDQSPPPLLALQGRKKRCSEGTLSTKKPQGSTNSLPTSIHPHLQQKALWETKQRRCNH